MASSEAREDPRRLLGAVMIWATVFEVLSKYGLDIFPRALLHELTLEAYLALIQLVTLGAGLGAVFALLRRPEAALPLRIPAPRRVLATVVLAPLVFSASTTVAFLVARPTLIAEIVAGGREMAEKNTGTFGRELVESPALLALLWGAVISPVGEELFFRGALWSLVQGAVGRLGLRRPPAGGTSRPPDFVEPSGLASAADGAGRWFSGGGLTTILVGSFFGFLHWDMPGGLGIVRFVSALGLGLACGVARQSTRSVTAPILLHVLYNALSLATVRRWVVTETFPMFDGAPTSVSIAGAFGSFFAALLSWRGRTRRTP